MSHFLELSQNLSEKLNDLEHGKLTEEGLNDAIQTVSKLQEALYILRFKGYEEREDRQENNEERQAIKLNFSANSAHQISILEAIEAADISSERTLNFVPENKTKQEGKAESRIAIVDETEGPLIKPLEPKKQEKMEAVPSSVRLNDKLNQDVNANRLGEKLQQSTIKDLRSAISVNQRFLFINALFDGKTEIFQESLERLDAAESRNEAKEIEQELQKNYAWENDTRAVEEFSSLIDRRFP